MDNRQNTYQQPRIPQAGSINPLQNTRPQIQRLDASRGESLRGEKNSVARRIETTVLAVILIASIIFSAAGDDILGIRYINLAFFIPGYAAAIGLMKLHFPEEFEWEDR